MAALKLALAAILSGLAAPAVADPVERWAVPIREASQRFAIPETWIRRVMRVESGGVSSWRGRPIVSAAGAMGLMQLMPATWREVRAVHRLGADPFDPRDNILAGAAYLRAMYDRFGYPGMFAAYNAGPSRYANHLATGRALPAETILYASKILGAEAAPQERGIVPPPRPTAAPLFVARSGTRPASEGLSDEGRPTIFVALAGGG